MRDERVLNESIIKTFFRYVTPGILGMIGTSTYILADTFFVANGVGSIGLTSLNIALPIFNLLIGLGLLIGIGFGTLFSIERSQKNYKRCNRLFVSALIITVILGGIFTLSGIFFSKDIVRMLGATEEILPIVNSYLKTVMIFSIVFILNQVLIAFIRNDGEPSLAMKAMLIGTVANTIFDYIFIYIFKWGMFGAALATCVCPIIGILILSTHIRKSKEMFGFNKINIRLKESLKAISIGFPSFITEFSQGIIIFLFNVVILDLAGEIGVASYGIIANIALVCMSIFTGIGQGIQPIISSNYGANKIHRVKKTLLLACIVAGTVGVTIYLIGLLFPNAIVSAFNSEGNLELQRITVEGIKLYFICFIMAGLNMTITIFFTSITKSRESMIISLCRGFFMVIIGLMIFPKILGLDGVFLTTPFSELITLVIAIMIYLKNKKVLA